MVNWKLKWINLYPITVILFSCVLSFSIRLFSIINFESIIHEFDPWFNYRSTMELIDHGFYKFLNWFDDKAWYPLGRTVGGTIYPGLMITSSVIYNILNFLSLTVQIRNVCVLLAPLFSCFNVIMSYLLTKEIWNSNAGLLCCCLMAIVPGYISRSSSGSYDNEGIAIFAMLLIFYCWIKSLKTGTIFWSLLCSFSYFYMVSAWGGYVYINNLISLHVIVLLTFTNYSKSLYVSYSVFYIFGLLFSMQIPFVGFQALRTGEHLLSVCAFILLQICFFAKIISYKIKIEIITFLYISLTVSLITVSTIYYLTQLGVLSPWNGRFYSLWDINYATVNLPIITSVSEHQPTSWQSIFQDLSILMCFYPAGIWFCFKFFNAERLFLILYSITASYFSGIMVRLILTLTPAVCISSSISFNMIFNGIKKTDSAALSNNGTVANEGELQKIDSAGDNSQFFQITRGKGQRSYNYLNYFSAIVGGTILIFFVFHSVFVTMLSYSNPSIVMASNLRDGSRVIIDDFREAYYWLKQNTQEDARIMSWWDYGYQITGMANRTTIVDNNTWNNSHIALVGKAMSSNETSAIKIIRILDVDYVLVLFGGLIGFSGDDINKFIWMIRISEGEHPKDIYEYNYFTSNGEYRVDKYAPKAMLDSLLYRLSYYRFGETYIQHDLPSGFDRTRGAEIGLKYYKLLYFEESFTSENWLIRIYKTKPLANRLSLKVARKKNKMYNTQKTLRKMKGALNFQRNIKKGIKKFSLFNV